MTSAQRREVTVLSVQADVQSTDPEDFANAAASLTELTKDLLGNTGATQFLAHNDRVMIAFGFPNAHDRQADIAVDVAMDILECCEGGISTGFGCKIGVSRGIALVSDNGQNGGFALSGAVVRDAEKLTQSAAQGTALIDESVRAALSPSVQAVPSVALHGALLLAPRGARPSGSIHDQFPKRHHTMVGRDGPMRHAVELLDSAGAGNGSAAAILGAPGEGKTRLVQEIIEVAETRGFAIQLFAGSPSDKKSTLAPVLDNMLRAGAFAGATNADRKTALDSWLGDIDTALMPAAEYFQALIGSGTEEHRIAVSKEVKDCVLGYFSLTAQNTIRTRPMLLIFEDAHWFDPTTCEAISRMIEELAQAPVLALLVARNGEAPGFMEHPLIQKIRLHPLDPAGAEALLRGLLPTASVPDSILSNILRRTEGNPLAIEQFAQAIEANATQLSELDLQALDRPGVAAA